MVTMSPPNAHWLLVLFVACMGLAAADPCDKSFGPFIEGTAVSKTGQVLAVNHGAIDQRNTIGFASGECGQLAVVNGLQGSQLNGLRVLSDGSILATDLGNNRVVLLPKGKPARTYCKGAMIQPNDLAISAIKGRVYLSGQKWADNNVKGDGDIWLCQKGAATRLAWDLGRTNGIELSLDESSLFISEAFNKGGRPVSNKIWRYALKADGTLGTRELFFDFAKDGTAHVDVDGMRLDTAGNLYVTRNEGKEVAVLSPAGTILRKIPLPFSAPTNLEFGGPDGKTLVVVGRCGVDTSYGSGLGCIAKFQVPNPGRYWSQLQKGGYQADLF
jgi:hypothetical protein